MQLVIFGVKMNFILIQNKKSVQMIKKIINLLIEKNASKSPDQVWTEADYNCYQNTFQADCFVYCTYELSNVCNMGTH